MIIGFTGNMQAGKTTCAEYTGFPIYSFASPVKAIATIMGWDGNKDEKGRKLLQSLGTETGRAYDELMWLKLMQKSLKANAVTPTFKDKWSKEHVSLIWWAYLRTLIENVGDEEPEDWVTDDVRFDNEAEWIHSKGGYVIQVSRPGFNGDKHASEKGVSDHLIDLRITAKDTDELKDALYTGMILLHRDLITQKLSTKEITNEQAIVKLQTFESKIKRI